MDIGVLKLRLEADARRMKAAMADAERSMKGTMAGMVETARNAGIKMAKFVALPLAGIGALAVRASTNFESEMTKISALVGIAQDQVNSWSNELKQLAPTLGKTPEELGQALYYVTSSGVSAADALSVVVAAAKASSAGLGDAASISNAVTSAVNAYGIASLSAARATDILAGAVREGKLESAEFASQVSKVVPLSKSMGVEFAELAGAMAAMSRVGSSASEAATSLTSLFSNLLKPSEQGRKALAGVGLSYEQLRKVIGGPNGILTVLRLLDQRFGENTEGMTAVLGDIRALRAAMNLLGQDAKTVDAIMAGVRNSTGAVDSAFRMMSQTGAFKLHALFIKMKTVMLDLGASISRVLLPTLEAAELVAKDLGSALNKLGAQAFKAVVVGVKQAATAVSEFVTANRAAVLLTGAVAGAALAVYGAFKIVTGAILVTNTVMGILGLRQAAVLAVWIAWKGALLAVSAVQAVYNGVLLLTSAATLSYAVVVGSLVPVMLAAKIATAAWGAATAVVMAILSPATLLAVTATVVSLGAAIAVVGSALWAAHKASSAALEVLSSIPRTAGPLQAVGAVIGEWGTILKQVVETAKTNLPKAWELLQAGLALAVSQVKDMMPPLWEFVSTGFVALWDTVSQVFVAKMTEAITTVTLEAARLTDVFGIHTEEIDATIKQAKEAADAASKEAIRGGKLEITRATMKFKVEDSDATKQARDQVKKVQDEIAKATKDAPPVPDPEKGVPGLQKYQDEINRNLTQPLKQAHQEAIRFDAALASGPEAMARVQEFIANKGPFRPEGQPQPGQPAVPRMPEPVQPGNPLVPTGSGRDDSKIVELLTAIRDNTAKDEGAVNLVPADFV